MVVSPIDRANDIEENPMTKKTLFSILTGILIAFCGWGATSIIENKSNIARVDQKEVYSRALLMEMQRDIKTIINQTK